MSSVRELMLCASCPDTFRPVDLLDFRADRGLVAVAYGATAQIVYLLITGDLSLDLGNAGTSGYRWLLSKYFAWLFRS